MSDDIRERLRDAAQEPQHPIDVQHVYQRGRRQRLGRVSAVTALTVVALGAVVVGALQLAGTRTPPVVGEGPQASPSVRVVEQLGAPGDVRVLVVESAEGLCVWFGTDARQGASCGLELEGAVAGGAVVLPDGSDGQGVIAGRVPGMVTSVSITHDDNTVTAQIFDTDAGRFFIATELAAGQHRLTASTADGAEYVAGEVQVIPNATSGVFLVPTPSVTGSPVLSLAGTEPKPWSVHVAPGEDARWCAIASLDDQPIRQPEGCDQLVGPDDTPQDDGFGVVSASEHPDGTGIAWGTVSADATRVMVVLPDGSRQPAELGSGPMAFNVWAVAYTKRPTRIQAFNSDGNPIGSRPFGTVWHRER